VSAFVALPILTWGDWTDGAISAMNVVHFHCDCLVIPILMQTSALSPLNSMIWGSTNQWFARPLDSSERMYLLLLHTYRPDLLTHCSSLT
jgi:hypothetical protein